MHACTTIPCTLLVELAATTGVFRVRWHAQKCAAPLHALQQTPQISAPCIDFFKALSKNAGWHTSAHVPSNTACGMPALLGSAFPQSSNRFFWGSRACAVLDRTPIRPISKGMRARVTPSTFVRTDHLRMPGLCACGGGWRPKNKTFPTLLVPHQLKAWFFSIATACLWSCPSRTGHSRIASASYAFWVPWSGNSWAHAF